MTCPKCGKQSTGPRWHEARTGMFVSPACGYDDTTAERIEHLHYYCVCGFDWTAPTVEQFLASPRTEPQQEHKP